MNSCSVIMPTYNRAKFLNRSIRSCLDQDCVGQIEVVVIDDGSTDETESVVKSIPSNETRLVKYIKTPHTGQPGTTRNMGLRSATGDFIAYCDSDDFWLPHHLATAFQAFAKDKNIKMVSNYWGFASFELSGCDIITKIIVPPHPTWAVNTNCRVHKKECLDVGDFNASQWGEDQDFFTRIEKKHQSVKTEIVTSVNGYIKAGNNLTYQFDQGVKSRFF